MAAATWFATPAAASALVFGANLNQPANNTITCADGWPNQLYPLGGAPFYDPGFGSCMWTGSSVSQTLQAPTAGVVSSVSVKVGPVTGPMQIVVLRTLYQNSTTPGYPNLACCLIQAYGPRFTPTANSVTTVPTNLSMDEQTTPPQGDPEVVHFDLLALEVLAPNVPVPAYSATAGAAESATPDFAWFPAPSQAGIGAPSANVVNYGGDFSGYQLLMSAELATPSPPPAPAPTPTPTPLPIVQQTKPTPKLIFPKLTLPVHNGRVALPIQCASANCVGNLLLQNLEQHGATIATAATAPKKSKPKPKTVTYGSAPINIKAGAKGTVTVKLNTTGKRATKGHRTVKVWANFTLGSARLSRRITLHG